MSIICIYVFKHIFLASVCISKIIVYQNYTAEGISKRIPPFYPFQLTDEETEDQRNQFLKVT